MSTKLFLLLTLLVLHVLSGTPVKIVDHEDPYYTDECLEVSGELCAFCCLTDQQVCSQDWSTCDAVLDRQL